MVVLAELKKKNQTWEQFLYELSNSHISSPLVNEVSKPHIPGLPNKVSSMNISKDRTSHIQEQGIKNCKRAGRSNAKKPRGLKGQQENSQFDSGQGQPDFAKYPVPSTRRFTHSMVA